MVSVDLPLSRLFLAQLNGTMMKRDRQKDAMVTYHLSIILPHWSVTMTKQFLKG